jgi:hypothetical protein
MPGIGWVSITDGSICGAGRATGFMTSIAEPWTALTRAKTEGVAIEAIPIENNSNFLAGLVCRPSCSIPRRHPFMGVHALWGSLGFANRHQAFESLRQSRTEAGVLNPFSIQNQNPSAGWPRPKGGRPSDFLVSATSGTIASYTLFCLDGREAVWSTVAQGSL